MSMLTSIIMSTVTRGLLILIPICMSMSTAMSTVMRQSTVTVMTMQSFI